MNSKESEEESSKREVPKEEALPSSLEAVDEFIDKVTNDSNRISFLDRPAEVVDKNNVDPITGTSMKRDVYKRQPLLCDHCQGNVIGMEL